MVDRSPARILAPLALLTALAGVGIVVAASRTDTPAPARTPSPVGHHAIHRKPRPRTYVVRTGDTLSAIASRTRVSLETLQALNPDVDPQALHAGERLKLRR